MSDRKPRRGSVRREILDLLADGRPRTSTEILRAVAADLDRRVRDTLHDLQGEGTLQNFRRSPEEGLWSVRQGDELVRRSRPVNVPDKPKAWWEL